MAPRETPELRCAPRPRKAPRLPAYVEHLWAALRRYHRSPIVKMEVAELFVRRIEAFKTATRMRYSRASPPPVLAAFERPENIALLCVALSDAEQREILDRVQEMLWGPVPAANQQTRPPARRKENP